MPNRDYYLLEGAKYDAYRAAYRAYVIQHPGARRNRRRGGQGRPDHRARDRDRQGPLDARAEPRHQARSTIRWTGAKLQGVRAAARLGPGARQARASATSRRSIVSRDDARSRPIGQAARQRAARRPGRTISPSTSSATTRTICPRRSTRPTSISIRRRCATSRPSATAGSAASTWSTARSAKAVGQIYVQRHYPPESDRQMGELIANIRAALQEKIETNSWMDAPTKKEALAKLASVRPAHRPPGQIYRLFDARGRARRPARQCHAVRRVRVGPAARRGCRSRSTGRCGT